MGSGAALEPTAKRMHKLAPFDCSMTNIFCVCCPLKESFRDIFVNHSPSRKKIWITQFGSCWGGIVSFFNWKVKSPPPPKKDVWKWSKRSVVAVRPRDCGSAAL